MDWKAHLLVGCIFGAVVGASLFGFGIFELALFSLAAGFCALLPDLDLRKSKASEILYAAAGIVIIAAAYYLSGMASGASARSISDFAIYALLLVLFAMLLDLFFRPKHRGVMHGILFLALITAAAYFTLGWFLALALATGYLSHLLADMCIKA